LVNAVIRSKHSVCVSISMAVVWPVGETGGFNKWQNQRHTWSNLCVSDGPCY